MAKDKKKKKDAPEGHPSVRKEDFKSEPVTEEQRQGARNKRPFFRNYDYTTEPANETSPGGGLWMNMHKYKSIDDFRKKKKKENDKVKSAFIKTGTVFIYDVER